MKCEKCQKTIRPGVKFCPNCGEPLKGGDTPKPESGSEKAENPGQKADFGDLAAKGLGMLSGESGKKNRQKLFALAGAVVILIMLCVILGRPKSVSLSPSEYVEVTCSGLNGEGKATLRFRTEQFVEALGEKKKLKPVQQSEIMGILKDADQYFSLTKNTELKNGDKLSIHSSMPEDLLKEYRIKLKGDEAGFTVAGLVEIQTLKPEDYGVISFSGFEGYGYVDYHLDYEAMYDAASKLVLAAEDSAESRDYIKYNLRGDLYACVPDMEVDKTSNVSNGDTIHVSYTVDPDNNRIETYGIAFEASEKDVEVSGLEAVKSLSLADYLGGEANGFDGNGTFTPCVEWERIGEDLEEKLGGERNGYSPEEALRVLKSSVGYGMQIKADKLKDVANGDKIRVYTQTSGEELYVGELGLDVAGGEKTVTVEGLEPVEVIELEDYLVSECSGYSGMGVLEVSLDNEALKEDLGKKFKEERNGYSPADIIEQIEFSLRYDFRIGRTETGYLTNQDTAELYVTCGDVSDYLEQIGVLLKSGSKTITIEGLDEPQDADLMDLVTVTFSGVCPQIQMDVSLDDSSPLYSCIKLSSYYDLPSEITGVNGDTVTITLEYDEQAALKAGYRVVNNTKTYEISGLSTYNYQLGEETLEALGQLGTDAEEGILAILMDNQQGLLDNLNGGSGFILWNRAKFGLNRIVKYYTEYSYDYYNKSAFLYEIALPILGTDGSGSIRYVYFPQYFNGIEELADGTYTYAESYGDAIYLSEEEALAAVEQLPDSINRPEGTECVKTVAANEGIEEALAVDMQQVFAQEFSGSVCEDRTWEYPSLPAEIANKAAAKIEYEGYAYYRFDEKIDWEAAKTLCEGAGGHLATINTITEQEALRNLVTGGPREFYWIGATDLGWEGEWRWVTGEPNDCGPFWLDGQPNNKDGKQHYLSLCASGGIEGRWNDLSLENEDCGYILELSPEQQESSRYLYEISQIHQEEATRNAWSDNTYGERHYGIVRYNASAAAWDERELNGAYTKMIGQISVDAATSSEACMNMTVFGDGRLLFKQTGLTRVSHPVTFEVDLTGVDNLIIATSNLGGGDGWLYLGHTVLYPSEQGEVLADIDQVRDLRLIDGSYTWRKGYLLDAFGNVYDYSIELDAGQDVYAAWNLEGNYTNFSGKFVTASGTGSRVSMSVRIYGDEELLYEAKGLNKAQDNQSFSIDVTGKQVLKIVTDDPMEGTAAFLYLVEDILTKAPEAVEPDAAQEENPLDWITDGTYQFPLLSLAAVNEAYARAEYENHQYYLFETPMTWKEAKDFCEKEGGHLAVITSPLEEQRIKQLLKNGTLSSYWLGGSDEEEEGTWKWVTGEEFAWSYWSSGNPDNYRHEKDAYENYLEIYREKGDWNDNSKLKETGFILEFSNDRDITKNYRELGEIYGRLTGSEKYSYYGSIEDSQGNTYLSSYVLDATNNAYASYDLNGEFASVRGVLSTYAKTTQNADMNIAFFGDGKLLYGKKKISGWSEAEAFKLDVTGVKTLTIKTSNTGDPDYGYLVLNDTFLTLAETPAECGSVTRIKDLQQVDTMGLSDHFRITFDTYGNMYENDNCYAAVGGSYAVYLLDGKYTEFGGYIIPGPGTKSGNCISIQIYGDGQLLSEHENITRMTEAIPFTLDVSGISLLKVVVSDSGTADEGYLYITNDYLK